MQGRLNNSDGFLSSFLSAKNIKDKHMRLPLLFMQHQLIPSSLSMTEKPDVLTGFLQDPQTLVSYKSLLLTF